ncbi:hypothetical protein ACFYMO_00935 [Streptomyces sp. NPDC007025]
MRWDELKDTDEHSRDAAPVLFGASAVTRRTFDTSEPSPDPYEAATLAG